MHKDDLNVFLAFAAVALTIIIVVCTMVMGAATAMTKSECLKLGYSGHQVDWTFSRYCIVRENQTDIVVPLETARRKPRG